MPATKALCIFTTLLGHKTMVQNIKAALNKVPGLEPEYVLTELDDYVKYPAPWWARATNPWQSQFVARSKAKPVLDKSFDILLVNAWELVVGFQDLARRIPAACVMDTIPATVNAQLVQQGQGGWKRSLSHRVHDRAFRSAARHFQCFAPMGSDCAQSLVRDYGIDPARCSDLTLAPQDLEVTRTALREYDRPIRLLFVGKDFFRKGGEFLLKLYSDHLSGACTLTIVSSDPGLDGRQFPKGVERFGHVSLDHLRQIYRESYVFVFPTQQDFMPQVLGESLAFGIPCIANDVGAVRDLVHDGETGFLMQRNDAPEKWAQRLLKLAENPGELTRMSQQARKFAEEKLSFQRFDALIGSIAERLRAKP